MDAGVTATALDGTGRRPPTNGGLLVCPTEGDSKERERCGVGGTGVLATERDGRSNGGATKREEGGGVMEEEKVETSVGRPSGGAGGRGVFLRREKVEWDEDREGVSNRAV